MNLNLKLQRKLIMDKDRLSSMLLSSRSQIYAAKRYHYEEQKIAENINKLDPEGKYKKASFNLEEFSEYIKKNFQDYYTVISLMWKGDKNLIEMQLKDDYISLCHCRNGVNLLNVINPQKQLLKTLFAYTIYWCDYRINHVTKDLLSFKESTDEINHTTYGYEQLKSVCLEKFNTLLDEICEEIDNYKKENFL